MSRSARMAAPFLAALIAVAGLGAADGGYFASDWGLATLGFALVAVTLVLVTDASAPERARARVPRRPGPVRGVGGALLALVFRRGSPGARGGARHPLRRGDGSSVCCSLSTREAAAALLGGVVAGAVLVSLYALGTRLFPGHVGGAYDPSSGYQLAEPIGYWNALGLLTALAILLALGFAAHGHIATRALAAVALVVLLPTLYFSFSRGALVALAGGARRAGSSSTRAVPGSSSRGSWRACRPRSACSRPRGLMRSLRRARPCRRHRPRAVTSPGGSSCLRSSRRRP